jgi:hypothetical protein
MISLAIKEMQIKTTLKLHLTPIRMTTIKKTNANVGEDVRKRESLYTAGGNINDYIHYGKLYGGSPKN